MVGLGPTASTPLPALVHKGGTRVHSSCGKGGLLLKAGVLMLQGLAHVPQSRQAGASLVAQCTGIRLPVQGTRI